jgi:hypothetical protein
MTRRLLTGALVAGLALLAGCPDNPYEADTWIEKLDDQREAERAVTELEHLGDPKAIPALGRTWDKQGKPVRVLQVIIDLAQPLTPKEAEEKFLTNFAKTGRKSSWDKALPILKQAVSEIDSANPRSLDSAVKAADALGDAQIEQAEEILIELANDPEHKLDNKALRVRLAAIVALGKYKDARAISALSAMLKKSLDDYAQADEEGKAAKDDNAKKGAFERSRDAGVQAGAAINALSEMRSPQATPVLIEAMYRLPGLATQTRRALVASGAGVAPEMKKILKGEHAEVNQLFTEKRLDKFCPPGAPATDCKPVSARDFYAALILGDLYDTTATPELLAALARDPLPVYYTADGPSPNSQHNAIFDALRKIGAADAAVKARAVWSDPKQPVVERALAVGAYGFLARDASAIAELRKLVNDPGTDGGLRQEMLTTIARVAQDAGDLEVFQALAKLNHDKYVEAKKKSEGKEKTTYDTAKKALADAKKKFADAKAAFLKEGGARKASAATIQAMTDAQKEVDGADEKHDDARAEWKPLDDERQAYLDFTRGVELHIARVEIALFCKKDAACYGKTLAGAMLKTDAEKVKAAEEIGARLAKSGYIKDWNEWSNDDKKLLIPAQAERAMLELGKMGQAAGSQLTAMLDAATTDDRIVRQSILLALPKVAKLPCAECEQKLAAAVKAGEGKSTISDLNVETMILRNYFSWAGGNKPSEPAPAPAPAP